MSLFNCNCGCKCSCTSLAIIAAIIIGVLTAFLQISGVIILTTVFLWVAFGIAVVYLGVLTVAAALARRGEGCCQSLTGVLAGILGTILFAVVLLAVGIVATSVISAILAGLLLFFLTLTLASTACYARCLADCGE